MSWIRKISFARRTSESSGTLGENDDDTNPRVVTVEVEDVRFAVTQFSAWVTNADTKAGLGLAGVALLVNGMVAVRPLFARNLPPATVRTWCFVTTYTMTTACVLITVGCLTLALLPRIDTQRFSRYSWPLVSRATEQELFALSPKTERIEGWHAAHALAQIARRKFRYLGFASYTLAAAISLFLLCILLAP
jgi:hypothetical protein